MDSKETERPLLDSQPNVKELSLLYRALRIVALFLLWLSFGAFSEITGPVVPELIAQTHSQYETIAQSLSMRGAGHALGGIIGGLTVDRWFHLIDILVAVVVIFYTAVSVGTSYVQSTTLLFIVFFIQGSIETWLQTAGYRIALRTWKDKAAGPLHALHMGYGIGSVAVPQLVARFLDPRFSGGVVETGYNSTCRINETFEATKTPQSLSYKIGLVHRSITPNYPANFVTAYWILCGYSLSLAAIYIIYHIHGRVTGIRIDMDNGSTVGVEKQTFRQSLSARNCSPTKPTFARLIVASLFFYYVVSVPLTRAFSKFIFSYARDGPCMTITESTTLESAYFTALTIGRFCAFVASSRLHMKFILQVEVIGVLTCALTLFFLPNNITILWIFCSALGFFTGPIIPSAFAWANRYIEVTSTAQIVPQVGAAMGDVAFLMGVGYSYQNYGPYVLWSYQLGLGIAICVVSWIMQAFGSLHGDRYHCNSKSTD